ncbi:H-type lectin domain-containing protein, partial [Hydrogenimonas sp.]
DGYRFKGRLDELKIYAGEVEAADVRRIYDNEKAGRNGDGSARYCQCCAARAYPGPVVPLQFEGAEVRLNTTTRKPHWTHISFAHPFDVTPVVFIVPEKTGGHPASTRIKNVTKEGFDAIMAEPQGEDGPHLYQNVDYFAINPGVHKIGNTLFEVGTLSTKKSQQASQGRLVRDEWERLDTLFSECTPAVVAQIQSLSNEEGLDIPNDRSVIRSIPWLTAAIESNGSGIYLALERSETDEGSIDESETIAYMMAEANVQDAFVDGEGKTILFETIRKDRYFEGWDDECKVVTFVQHYTQTPLIAGNKNSKFEKDGGWFRRCYLEKDGVGFQIDEDGSRYSKGRYGYKVPPQDKERTHRGEDGSVFVFSENFFVRESLVPNGYFDVWDVFRDLGDRNISTKRAGETFLLTLASLTSDGSDYLEFNGTVCTRILRKENNVSVTGWQKHLFEEENRTRYTVRVDRALPEAAVQIVWKSDVDESCPLSHEENTTLSTDTFALRPDRFVFRHPEAAANLTAEHAYRYTSAVEALDVGGNPAADYNTTLVLRTTKRMRNGEANDSLAGTLHTGLSDFQDGVADLNLSFDDVAIVTLELNDTAWCAVDADDTPEANRTIYGERNVTFVPAAFGLSFSAKPQMEDNDTAHGFTYLSNDLAMSGWLRGLTIDVKALGEKGGLLRNFSGPVAGPLFADAVDITPLLRLPERHSAANTLGEPQPQTGVDLNFTGGEAVLTYSDVAFNYDRTYDAPVDPFFVPGGEANIMVSLRDVRYPSAAGAVTSDFDGGATFYFGRLRVEDLRTTKASVTNDAELEVFDTGASAFVAGFRQNSLRWFGNEKHASAMNGRIKEANATVGVALDSAADGALSIRYDTYGSGVVMLEINNTSGVARTRTIHLDIDPWLWYVPKGFGEAYDYGSGSDC